MTVTVVARPAAPLHSGWVCVRAGWGGVRMEEGGWLADWLAFLRTRAYTLYMHINTNIEVHARTHA